MFEVSLLLFLLLLLLLLCLEDAHSKLNGFGYWSWWTWLHSFEYVADPGGKKVMSTCWQHGSLKIIYLFLCHKYLNDFSKDENVLLHFWKKNLQFLCSINWTGELESPNTTKSPKLTNHQTPSEQNVCMHYITKYFLFFALTHGFTSRF